MKIKTFLVGLTGILFLSACVPASLPPTAATTPVVPTPRPFALDVTQAPPPSTWTPTAPATLAATPLPQSTRTPPPTSTPFPTRAPTRTPAATLPTTATLTPTLTLSETEGITATDILSATPTLTPTATPVPIKILAGDFNAARAIVLIYENPYATVSITPLLTLPFKQDGVDKLFFIAEIPGKPCPTCKASLGGAIFIQKPAAWQIEIEGRHITTLGTYGRAPQGDRIQFGDDRYGVLFRETITTTTGFTERAVLIAPVDDAIREIFAAATAAGAPSDAPTPWAYTSEITFAPGNHPYYYDLTLITRGNRPIEGVIESFETTSSYLLLKTGYQLADTQTKLNP